MVVSGKKFQRQNSGSPKIKQKDIKERGESSKREVTKGKKFVVVIVRERQKETEQVVEGRESKQGAEGEGETISGRRHARS